MFLAFFLDFTEAKKGRQREGVESFYSLPTCSLRASIFPLILGNAVHFLLDP